MSSHEYYMRKAMQRALKGRGSTAPNPVVGALVVKNGRIVGSGYHKRAGAAHAEVIALDQAGPRANAATLYVTLEPCTHFGKTPPCVHRIIASGVREVVVGMVDPNPLNNGKGVETLRRNGIRVNVGFIEKELRIMNEAFIKYITRRIPFITVKVGQSLDGRIATRSGDSKWITSDASRALAHRMRGSFDAIMVGVNTVLRDNPLLEPWFSKKRLTKIIVDSRLSTPQDAALFAKDAQVIVATLLASPGQQTANRANLAQRAKILDCKERGGQVNLKDMMKRLAQGGISNILVEGGGTLIGSLFDEGLVDKVLFFISPTIVGGKEAVSSVMGRGVSRIERAIRLKDVTLRRVGVDIMVEGYVQRYY